MKKVSFALKDLKRLAEVDTRWTDVLAVTKEIPFHMDLTDPANDRSAIFVSCIFLK